MMERYKKHILICDDDIVRYPPIISNIQILANIGVEVIIFGYCSSSEVKKLFKNLGVKYIETKVDKIQKNPLGKLLTMFSHTKAVHRFLEKIYTDDTIVWIFGNENGWRLNSVIKKYRCILYLFEMPFFSIPLKYKLITPFLNLKKSLNTAWRVVCCEYNRARITQAIFNLKTTPYVIPNKPIINLEKIDKNISDFLDQKIINKLDGKKILLYQGAIDNKKRRIDYICDAMENLSDDFVFCVMATESKDRKFLENKYKDKRTIFLPFIPPPYHLLVTKQAYIGFLTYNTDDNSKVEECLNLLYCAPNKIFEYSMFNIPMIGNDMPALKITFSKFNAGISTEIWNKENIITAIKDIEANYVMFSEGSKNLYDLTNIEKLIEKLIEK